MSAPADALMELGEVLAEIEGGCCDLESIASLLLDALTNRDDSNTPLALVRSLQDWLIPRLTELNGQSLALVTTAIAAAAAEHAPAARCGSHVPCDGIDLCEHCQVREDRLERAAGGGQ